MHSRTLHAVFRVLFRRGFTLSSESFCMAKLRDRMSVLIRFENLSWQPSNE